MNLAGNPALTINTGGELVAASPTKQNLLGASGFSSLPTSGASPQASPGGVHVVSASKPIKNDPRTSFSSTVSGMGGVSPCSTPPPRPIVTVIDQFQLNSNAVSQQVPGRISYLSPGLHQTSAILPTPRPPTPKPPDGKTMQLASELQQVFGAHRTATAEENVHLSAFTQEEMLNLRRQSAPAAHITPPISSAQHLVGYTLNVPTDAAGSPPFVSLRRHHSHVGLSSLAQVTSSPQPFPCTSSRHPGQVASGAQRPAQRIVLPLSAQGASCLVQNTPPYSSVESTKGSCDDQSHSLCPSSEQTGMVAAVGLVSTNYPHGQGQTASSTATARAPVSLQPQAAAAMSEHQTCPFSTLQPDTTPHTQQKVYCMCDVRSAEFKTP